MDFERLKINEGEYWEIYLHQDQTCPGRLYFWYKGEAEDLLDISEEALLDFLDLARKTRKTLTDLFQPDMFNYLALGNKTKHLHIHLIPRYSREINKFGVTFRDVAYGSGYKSNPDLKMTEEVISKIKNSIEESSDLNSDSKIS